MYRVSGFFYGVFISDALGPSLCVSVSVEQGRNRALVLTQQLFRSLQNTSCKAVSDLAVYLQLDGEIRVDMPWTKIFGMSNLPVELLICSYVGTRLVGYLSCQYSNLCNKYTSLIQIFIIRKKTAKSLSRNTNAMMQHSIFVYNI